MEFKIKAEKRGTFGKNEARRLRKEGMMPAVLYGAGRFNIPLTLKKKDLFAILKSELGERTIFQVTYDSEIKNAMIKELQRNPVTDEILHADFIQIAMDKAIRVSIPVIPVGEAVGVKTEGGFVDLITREVEIECLPKNIPEHLKVDISNLHLRQSLKVGDLAPPEGVRLISHPDTLLVLIEAPSKEEEVVVEAEEEVVAEAAEPEVIKKERGEEEEKGEEREKEKEKKE
jgi:large subunit ribosomal protein L25